jgi:hypothetical protein
LLERQAINLVWPRNGFNLLGFSDLLSVLKFVDMVICRSNIGLWQVNFCHCLSLEFTSPSAGFLAQSSLYVRFAVSWNKSAFSEAL